MSERIERLEQTVNTKNRMIAELEEYLKENIEDLEDHAEPIAKIFGFSLTQEIYVEGDFHFSGYVTVPLVGFDCDDIEAEVSGEVHFSSYTSDIDNISIDVDDVSNFSWSGA